MMTVTPIFAPSWGAGAVGSGIDGLIFVSAGTWQTPEQQNEHQAQAMRGCRCFLWMGFAQCPPLTLASRACRRSSVLLRTPGGYTSSVLTVITASSFPSKVCLSHQPELRGRIAAF